MNTLLPKSELIINDRGAIYHLDLRPEEIADKIILVGDPDRVPLVSRYFDHIETKRNHREFVTHTGKFHHHRLSVISTGIGTDNIDIVLNEIDALFNIEFEERKIKTQKKQLDIIRIGTTGSLQADILVDEFVVSTHGLALDNLLHFYNFEMTESEKLLINEWNNQVDTIKGVYPYVVAGSPQLLNLFNAFHKGITLTAPGFYGPQGRILRLGLRHPTLNQQVSSFKNGTYRISNFEMETSAIYALGRTLGHRCVSTNLVVANRISNTFSNQANERMKVLIETVLSQLLLLD